MKKVLYAFLLFSLMFVTAIFSIPKIYATTFDFSPYFSYNHKGYIDRVEGYVTYIYINGTELTETSTPSNHAILDMSLGFNTNDWTYDDYNVGPIDTASHVGETVYWDPVYSSWVLTPTEYWATIDLIPVYDGETAFVTHIDNLISVDDIMSRVKAIDNEDGDISHLINIVSSTYDPAVITTLGTYFLELSVTDSSSNTATLTVQVLVKDVTDPIITGTSSYNQSYTSKKNVADILAALSVTDNYDAGLTINVSQDNYTANYNKIGSYTIIFSSKDNSNNEGLYTVTVNVIDDVKPVFTGATTIMKGQSEILTTSQITSNVTVNDAIDGVLTFTVLEDNYTGNGAKVGQFTIVLQAIDTSGNIQTHTITVTVEDNIPPVFYVDNFFINVSDAIALTRQDIIDLLVASGQLTINATTNVNFVMNEYEGNETVPGTYALTLMSSSSDGSSSQTSLAVVVYEETSSDVIVEPDTSIFEDAWTWLKTPVKEGSKFYNAYYIGLAIIFMASLVFFANIKTGRGSYRRR